MHLAVTNIGSSLLDRHFPRRMLCLLFMRQSKRGSSPNSDEVKNVAAQTAGACLTASESICV
jgi:hypothetical protein